MQLDLGLSLCSLPSAVLAPAATGGGVAPGTPLLVWSEGQFNRQHDANITLTYRTSASAFSLGVADTPRLENTGDGNGPLLLCEGERACINTNSRAISAWTAANGASVAANTENGPEGALTADAVTFPNTTIGNVSQTQTGTNVASSSNLCWQVWAKRASGQAQDEKFRFWLTDKSAAPQTSADQNVTAAWQRFSWDTSSGAGAGNPVFRLGNASDAAARGAGRVVAFSAICVEQAAYPTSLILNETASQLGKRREDLMVFLPAQVPQALRQGKWSIGVRTDWANTNLSPGDVCVLFSWGDASNTLRFRHDGTNVVLEADNYDTAAAGLAAEIMAARPATQRFVLCKMYALADATSQARLDVINSTKIPSAKALIEAAGGLVTVADLRVLNVTGHLRQSEGAAAKHVQTQDGYELVASALFPAVVNACGYNAVWEGDQVS